LSDIAKATVDFSGAFIYHKSFEKEKNDGIFLS